MSDTAEAGESRSRERRLSGLLYVTLFTWIVILLWQALQWGNPEDWLFPVIVGVPLLGLIAIQFIRAVRLRHPESLFSNREHGDASTLSAEAPDGDEQPKSVLRDPDAWDRALMTIGWLVVLSVLLYYVGFVITTPLFLILFIYSFSRDPSRSVLVGTGTSIAMYLIFIEILDMVIWRGVWHI